MCSLPQKFIKAHGKKSGQFLAPVSSFWVHPKTTKRGKIGKTRRNKYTREKKHWGAYSPEVGGVSTKKRKRFTMFFLCLLCIFLGSFLTLNTFAKKCFNFFLGEAYRKSYIQYTGKNYDPKNYATKIEKKCVVFSRFSIKNVRTFNALRVGTGGIFRHDKSIFTG